MRASKSFFWPERGIYRLGYPKHPSSAPEMTPGMRSLAAHLALSGPVLAGQAARWLAETPSLVPHATTVVEAAIRSGWLQKAVWVPALPESGVLIPHSQRMVGLSVEAAQNCGLTPTWRWSAHMICRAAPLTQLLLRFPRHMRDWRPLREEPRSHVVGWIRVSERTALIVVLRKARTSAEEAESAIAAVHRAQSAIARCLWVIVPHDGSDNPHERPDSPEAAPEVAALAHEVVSAAGVLDRALLTTDAKLWDWDLPLHQAFSTWDQAKGSWVHIAVAALRDLDPAAAPVATV